MNKRAMVTIEGTDFEFDVEQLALVEQNKHENVILFSDMAYHDDHYTFSYDTVTRNLPDIGSSDSVSVQVPTMTALAPEATAEKYGRDIASIAGISDLELIVPNYEGFLQRVSGVLPHIEIAGFDFIIDWRLKGLRLADDVSTRLSFHDFYRNSDDDSFHFAFDTVSCVIS